MGMHIIKSTSAPSDAPDAEGIHWIKTTDPKGEWVSVGTASVGDWLERGAGGGGGFTGTNIPPKPLFMTGQKYRGLGLAANPGTATAAANKMMLSPFVAAQDITIDNIGFQRNSGTTSANIVVMIYDSDPTTNGPKNLLGKTILASSAPGVTQGAIDTGNLALTAGEQYWIGTLFDLAISVCAYSSNMQMAIGSPDGNFLVGAVTHYAVALTYTTTPPTPLTPVAADFKEYDSSLPYVFYRMV